MTTTSQHKLDFTQLKAKVGVTDVAMALGYHLDRKAGVGRYVEMVKGSGENKDTLVVSNPNDKSKQFFFRRNGTKGDAITLVRENIFSFNVQGKSEWDKVGRVLANLANEPVIDNLDKQEIAEAKVAQVFDASRYDVKQFSREGDIPILLKQRGFNEDTFLTFAPYITKVFDLQNEKFKGYNVGFPYTVPGIEGIQGYEMRGSKGFKSKAAGTNSTSGVWVADFSNGFPQSVKYVYFFESAYDAMAFYQANSKQIDLPTSAFVSVGGQLSDGQVQNLLKQYPLATMVDCFDNDAAGRKYAGRLRILSEDKRFRSQIAPDGFKDWNDFIRGVRQDNPEVKTKFQRNEALAERRKGLTL